MKIEIMDCPSVAIIGKEGLCTKEKNIVKDLWEQANADFNQVKDLGLKNPDGSYVGFWGAMSDETRSFLPWTDNFSKGLYLAGVQTDLNASAPSGWTKWIMPARKYLCAEVKMDSYHEVFQKVINEIIPERGFVLIGAVCDYTDPKTGVNKLLFPVESITER